MLTKNQENKYLYGPRNVDEIYKITQKKYFLYCSHDIQIYNLYKKIIIIKATLYYICTDVIICNVIFMKNNKMKHQGGD